MTHSALLLTVRGLAGILLSGALMGTPALRPLPAAGSDDAPRPAARPAGDRHLPTCAPGPLRLSEMDRMDGYLKVSPRPDAAYTSFTFARAMYSDGGGGFGFGFGRGGDYLGDGGPSWSIDYPDADRHMMLVARRLSNLDACEWGLPVSLADPDLRRFPFLYSLEWGYAALTEAEVTGLRSYLEAGGFLMIDDFWGSLQWANFEQEMARVLPGRPIVEVPRDHVFFRIYYDIKGDIIQVPGAQQGLAIGHGLNAPTFQQDGYVPHVRGIFDADGRLMVIIHWNTDLGDALEWAEDPYYPLDFSRYASELFLNSIMYGLTY
jgi:hypothetical protein